MKAIVSALLLAFSIVSSAQAAEDDWTEFRRVDLDQGGAQTLDLGDTIILVEGDSLIVRRLAGRFVTISVSDTAERWLRFERKTLGPLEVIVNVRSRASSSPAIVAPAPPRKPAAMVPPISAPPRPLVLETRPAPETRRPPSAPISDRAAPATAEVDPTTSARIPHPATLAPEQTPEVIVVEQQSASASEAAPTSAAFEVDPGAKPGELAVFSLASDLQQRGLYGDAIVQYRRLLDDFPRTKLRQGAMTQIGYCYRRRAEEFEKESSRQRDLRRSGAANDATDAAIRDFSLATDAFRSAMKDMRDERDRGNLQLAVAQSLHGLVRTQFMKGNTPQDSPSVVVEYLKSFVATSDSAQAVSARIGIAQYYRDLGDARLLAAMDKADILRAYNRAVEEYKMIITLDPQSAAAERALIDLARLYDRNQVMRRFSEAVRYYDELADKFPSSQFLAEARTRSKWIKSNYLYQGDF